MQIYVHRNNQQLGPFTEEEIKAQLASGVTSLQDHVWWQGQPKWLPLGQTSLMASAAPAIPGYVHNIPVPTGERTSGLAIASLVSNIVCGIGSLVAIVLGHLSLAEIKKNPALQGRGIALAGLIIGYSITFLCVISVVAISVLIALGNQVKGTFKTIDAQLNSAQMQNSSTDTDQTTNSPDQSTNSAPASTNSPDTSTNAAPTPTVTP